MIPRRGLGTCKPGAKRRRSQRYFCSQTQMHSPDTSISITFYIFAGCHCVTRVSLHAAILTVLTALIKFLLPTAHPPSYRALRILAASVLDSGFVMLSPISSQQSKQSAVAFPSNVAYISNKQHRQQHYVCTHTSWVPNFLDGDGSDPSWLGFPTKLEDLQVSMNVARPTLATRVL